MADVKLAIVLASLALSVAIACVRGQTNAAPDATASATAPARQEPVSLALEIAMPDYAAGSVESTMAIIGNAAISPEMTASGKVLRYGGFGPAGGQGSQDKHPFVIVPLIEGVDASLTAEDVRRDKVTLRLMIIQPHPKGKQLLESAARRVVTALVEQPPLTNDERDKRMKAVLEQMVAVEDKMNLLEAIAKNNRAIGPEILKERIKNAELEKQRLEMDRAALRVRRDAIARQLEQSTKDVNEALARDEVLQRLREIIPLREKEVARVETMIDQGAASKEELAGFQEKVVEARLRVAEREQALRQGNKAGLLERLNDELATTMINQAEMEVRLALLHEQQPSIDVKQIDEEKLTRLSDQYRGLFRESGALPPLYHQMDKRLDGLKRQRLALLVDDVRVTDAPPVTRPEMAK
jgi:hypothetical protein